MTDLVIMSSPGLCAAFSLDTNFRDCHRMGRRPAQHPDDFPWCRAYAGGEGCALEPMTLEECIIQKRNLTNFSKERSLIIVKERRPPSQHFIDQYAQTP